MPPKHLHIEQHRGLVPPAQLGLSDGNAGWVLTDAGDDVSGQWVDPSTLVTAPPTPTLAEVLVAGNDPDGTAIKAADDTGEIGASLALDPGDSGATHGGGALLAAGAGSGGDAGAALGLTGGGFGGAGGPVSLQAGTGAPGNAGGQLTAFAGDGDDFNDFGSGFFAEPGSGAGTHGKVGIFTDGTYGDAGKVLTATGTDRAIWSDIDGGSA